MFVVQAIDSIPSFSTKCKGGEGGGGAINLLHSNTRIKFLDRTRLSLSRANFKAIMTLEAGSTFENVENHENNITIIPEQEAEWVTHSGNKRWRERERMGEERDMRGKSDLIFGMDDKPLNLLFNIDC